MEGSAELALPVRSLLDKLERLQLMKLREQESELVTRSIAQVRGNFRDFSEVKGRGKRNASAGAAITMATNLQVILDLLEVLSENIRFKLKSTKRAMMEAVSGATRLVET